MTRFASGHQRCIGLLLLVLWAFVRGHRTERSRDLALAEERARYALAPYGMFMHTFAADEPRSVTPFHPRMSDRFAYLLPACATDGLPASVDAEETAPAETSLPDKPERHSRDHEGDDDKREDKDDDKEDEDDDKETDASTPRASAAPRSRDTAMEDRRTDATERRHRCRSPMMDRPLPPWMHQHTHHAMPARGWHYDMPGAWSARERGGMPGLWGGCGDMTGAMRCMPDMERLRPRCCGYCGGTCGGGLPLWAPYPLWEPHARRRSTERRAERDTADRAAEDHHAHDHAHARDHSHDHDHDEGAHREHTHTHGSDSRTPDRCPCAACSSGNARACPRHRAESHHHDLRHHDNWHSPRMYPRPDVAMDPRWVMSPEGYSRPCCGWCGGTCGGRNLPLPLLSRVSFPDAADSGHVMARGGSRARAASTENTERERTDRDEEDEDEARGRRVTRVMFASDGEEEAEE